MPLTLTSSAFADGQPIPRKYTCEGEDISPPLAWSGVPADARSLVLIVDDPDAPDPTAPRMTWVHWVLYNLPPNSTGLGEGGGLPAGAAVGTNDWKRQSYGGPCPPIGRHRYFHKLYALDALLEDLRQPSKAEVEKAMARAKFWPRPCSWARTRKLVERRHAAIHAQAGPRSSRDMG